MVRKVTALVAAVLIIANSYTPQAGGVVEGVAFSAAPLFKNAARSVRDAQDERKAVGEYVHTHNSNANAGEVARLLQTAAREYGVDVWVLTYIARFESTFKIGIRNRIGCMGLLQIHPVHRKSMAKMGLSFDDELDRLRFGCILYKAQGLGPWEVRSSVRAEIRRRE